MQVIELQDVGTEGRDSNASPLLDDNPSTSRAGGYDQFDRESMQDMEMREDDEFVTRGENIASFRKYCFVKIVLGRLERG